MTSTIVNVALNRPLFKEFAYVINKEISDSHIGCRVKVNFANSTMIGVITKVGVKNNSSIKLKEATLIDEQSFITDDVIKMLEFGSNYYQYPLGQCFNVALPKLLREGGAFSYEKIPALQLCCNIDGEILKKIKSDDQKRILDLLKTGPIQRKELRERGFLSSTENALIKKKLVEIINIEKKENEAFSTENILKETPPQANTEQLSAIYTVQKNSNFKVFLINGITGSGKTEVYLRIIEDVLKKGKSVLVLVPEISLTPQTFDRFYRRFNVPVSSVHSALSDRERLDSYIDMATGNSGILIGTRTAVFTPIKNLGLIVIDEEHDSSFKQNDTFRYHARTLAIMRAKINNCPVILGSATPSLETLFNCYKGLYSRIDLKYRAGGASYPDFELIDLTKEPVTEGLNKGLSQTLEDRIGEETAKGDQVLLFLNRRGYAHHLVCHLCGHVFTCPNCDNILTVHKTNHRLQCHICDTIFTAPEKCPVCENTQLFEQGFGTEQVSDYLKDRYPDVGIERIDRDSVTTKNQLEIRLNRVRDGKSQIMLGTQMLAKGHDFPNVTMVAMLDIDSSLFCDDFRAMENTAQLLTQVAGRAGRGTKKGKVIIQTHHIDNELINDLINPQCSYIDIANKLLETRKKLSLPPYSYQAFILCNSSIRNKAFNFLSNLSDKIKTFKDNYSNLVITPVMSDKMEKIQNRFHFHILVTCTDRNELRKFLTQVRNTVEEQTVPNDIRFAIEVDPIAMY
ncbi:primosomal protein N' [Succinivibrio sp.]|uniref:replication restart helicase PriA n=1 Tax=Succinivibrio sp. TaxID=2053619 RepID=UPI002582A09D|nr:primosomal protein N' [Succinivibrio sp.]MDD6205353.1 primosomal protein N' [Succinivibrio sp.]